MTSAIRFAPIFILGTLLAATTNAAVVYQERSRTQGASSSQCDLSCMAEGGLPEWQVPPADVSTTDFAPFTNTYTGLATSSLSYSLDQDGIEFSATALAWPQGSGRSDAYAAFSTTFVLTSATQFSFTGQGSIGGFENSAVTFALTGAGLDLSRSLEVSSCCGPAQMFSLSQTGILAAGTYVLSASAKNINSIAPEVLAAVYGNLTLQPVPLPGAAWLLGSGIIALVRFRRRGATRRDSRAVSPADVSLAS